MMEAKKIIWWCIVQNCTKNFSGGTVWGWKWDFVCNQREGPGVKIPKRTWRNVFLWSSYYIYFLKRIFHWKHLIPNLSLISFFDHWSCCSKHCQICSLFMCYKGRNLRIFGVFTDICKSLFREVSYNLKFAKVYPRKFFWNMTIMNFCSLEFYHLHKTNATVNSCEVSPVGRSAKVSFKEFRFFFNSQNCLSPFYCCDVQSIRQETLSH